MIQSMEEAVQLLEDTHRAAEDRERAIHYIAANEAGPAEIAVLVTTLDDHDTGIRFAAGSALARCGKMALKPMAEAVALPGASVMTRQGVHHALKDNVNGEVQRTAADLIKALEGPGSDVAAMQAAISLLGKL